MRIIHTESSPGWGGQERRILCEAQGMRDRGHEVLFCVQKGGALVGYARKAGFKVYEICLSKRRFFTSFLSLLRIFHKEKVELVNTHSSDDAWIAGLVARCLGLSIIRTRHLSSSIRPGINSCLLYNTLADYVVTTCAEIVPLISKQANLSADRCVSIPTGVTPFSVDPRNIEVFRQRWGIQSTDCVIGTLCVLRGWKGVLNLLQAACILKERSDLKWLIVGSGPSEDYFQEFARQQGLDRHVIFTGHLEAPFEALGAMDIFCLLSNAHEGVSQASLQASWMEKPLITTSVGGLKEVCIPQQTGILVPIGSPVDIAKAVETLAADGLMRQQYGRQGKLHVQRHFLSERMLDRMEELYLLCDPRKKSHKKMAPSLK